MEISECEGNIFQKLYPDKWEIEAQEDFGGLPCGNQCGVETQGSDYLLTDYWLANTLSIDYRCDDQKKNSWVGATPWYHCLAEDSRIPKILVINPLQTLVHPQTQKKKKKEKKNYPARIVNFQTPTSQNLPFW